MIRISDKKIGAFRERVWAHYRREGREMPWRDGKSGKRVTPYHILVSEVMLQQTQVPRVVVKFAEFTKLFPTVAALAMASAADVIRAWQGLGYNRRALNLHKAAQIIVRDHKGKVPRTRAVLEALPGIGPATAGAILAYAFNEPEVFIETNIRAVFIHEFWKSDHGAIHDKELLPLVARALDMENPREWYWALMDYGVMLKEKHKNPSRRSAHHITQKPFATSDRYVRGNILKILARDGVATTEVMAHTMDRGEARVARLAATLETEGFIKKRGDMWRLV